MSDLFSDEDYVCKEKFCQRMKLVHHVAGLRVDFYGNKDQRWYKDRGEKLLEVYVPNFRANFNAPQGAENWLKFEQTLLTILKLIQYN